jgi:hypothetical protein
MGANRIREEIRKWEDGFWMAGEYPRDRLVDNPDWSDGYAVGVLDAYRHALDLLKLEKNTPTKETDERMGRDPRPSGDPRQGPATRTDAPQLRPDPKVERRRRGSTGKPYRLPFLPRD